MPIVDEFLNSIISFIHLNQDFFYLPIFPFPQIKMSVGHIKNLTVEQHYLKFNCYLQIQQQMDLIPTISCYHVILLQPMKKYWLCHL